jgi:hypothetical protein
MANGLNAGIILQGNGLDVVGAMDAGAIAGQRANQFRQQNALNGFLQQNGSQVMNGDQNALNALAGFGMDGLNAAQGVQSNRLGMDQTRLGMDATRQNMALAQSQEGRLTRQEQRAIEEHAATMSREERTAQAERVRAGIAQGTQLFASGDLQGLNTMLTQIGEQPVQSLEQFPAVAGRYEGMLEIMEGVRDFTTPQGPEWIAATPEQAAQFNATAGQINTKTGKFEAENAPSGMNIVSDGNGGFTFQQGSGVGGSGKPLTVDEGKNTGFLIRAQDSQAVINQFEGQGTEVRSRILNAVPFGAGNFAQSPEYQQYDQAKRDMINAILRRESGAVIGPDEFASAELQYFPQPGDSNAVIEQKRQTRENAIEGLRVGSGDGVNRVGESRQSGANPTVDFSTMQGPDLLSTDMTGWTDADFAAYNKRMDELGL